MNTIDVMKQALEVMVKAIEIGDWEVDGRCDPDSAIRNLKQAIKQAEQTKGVIKE